MDAALFHEPRRRMIRLSDGEMAALDFGDAARPIDLLFVHANGFNAQTYRSILGPLSLSLRILAVDLRGHGASRLPTDPRPGRGSWNDFRDDLVNLLDQLGGAPLTLAGHSMGGTTVLLAAAQRPKRVRNLVLFDPVILPRMRALTARLPGAAARWRRTPLAQGALKRRAVFDSSAEAFRAYRGRGAFKTWPETMIADYVAAGFRDRPDGTVELACAPAWEASNFAAQGHDSWGALRKVRAPLTIYRAEVGSTCRIAPAALHRRNPTARLFTVEGASHFLPMERPDVVRDALLDATD